jgi:3'-phosphoadenosine 5'-phosphosulfate sulfotransferase (PAPS reductase)/FAD synthetase
MSHVKHIVALSGGKDSTAMALFLRAWNPDVDYTYVCTPTGDELPEMFEHWNRLAMLLGKPIIPIMHSTGLKGVIRKEGTLPNFRRRFCTRILKIEPYRRWLAANTPCVSYVGLRADEEGRAGGAYGDIPGVEMRFPLREAGFDAAMVWQFLAQQGVAIPRRTDCARCYHQRIGEWWQLWKDFPELWADAEADEAEFGGTYRTPGRDSWPSALKDLRAEFEGGRIPKTVTPGPDGGLRDIGACRVCTL